MTCGHRAFRVLPEYAELRYGLAVCSCRRRVVTVADGRPVLGPMTWAALRGFRRSSQFERFRVYAGRYDQWSSMPAAS